ncbi:50S ribosomal protein L13 [bacterium HR23]|nr:50S ribosomal protein L13 [bacterium HR23]
MTKVKSLKTYVPTPQKIHARWHLINAEGQVLGRLASRIARLLQGKHKPIYTPHLLTGDFVVVVNAAKVQVTGKKMRQKIYYFHSGYPGGLRAFTLEQMLQRDPERVLRLAVQRMLPKTRLGRKMLSRLKVYAGPAHPHQAQIAGFPPEGWPEEVKVSP